MAADRFVSVDLDMALWVLDNMRHDSRPPDAHMVMEMTAAMMDGRLHRYTQRAWQSRWSCSRTKVRDIADKVADRYLTFAKDQDRSGKRPAKDQWGTTLLQSFPHLSKRCEPAKDQPRTEQGPTRARSLLRREEEEGRRTPARQPRADGSIPFPGQDKPAAPPEKTEAEKGLDILREIRTEHHQAATGSKPRGVYAASGKAKAALLARVKRYLGEVKGAQYGEPLEVLRTYAEWVYLGPDPFWRGTSDPLGQALGGKANDPTNRLARTVAALDWQDAGGGTLPRVREMVAGLEGLVKRHAYLTHAVEGEPEEVAEQFKGLLETATGIDRTEVWARMRSANAWQFGKWTEAARAAM